MSIGELKKELEKFDNHKTVYLKHGGLEECYKALRVSGDDAGSVVLMTFEQYDKMPKE